MILEKIFSPVYDSLKNRPEDWEIQEEMRWIKHLPSNHLYYIDGPPFLFSCLDNGINIGYIERHFCWFYVRRMIRSYQELKLKYKLNNSDEVQ